MPGFRGRAPGKLLLVGEHAVVHGEVAFALPFEEVAVEVLAVEAERSSLHCELWEGEFSDAPEAFFGLIAAVEAAMADAPRPLAFTLGSTIPHGRGLGSSAAAAAAMVRAARAALGLGPDVAREVELVAIAERHAHGNPSGVDGQVIVSGFPLSFHRDGPVEAVEAGAEFHLVVADSGLPRDTRAAVAAVRTQLEADPLGTRAAIGALGVSAEAAMTAWRAGDAVRLGACLNAAQLRLDKLGVSHASLDFLVGTARGAGALGAKLTGAGRGGCMLALARDAASAQQIAAALTAAGATKTWTPTYRPQKVGSKGTSA